MRRYVVNRESAAHRAAVRIREAFQAAPAKKVTPVSWQWPATMQEVGECMAVMYSSNKWQKNAQTYIDYKHNREAPQRLLVRKGFLHHYDSGKPLAVDGEWVDLDRPMPDAFAELAPILGVQFRSYRDGQLYQVNIAQAKLGAAEHPKTKETFLLIYTSNGVQCIVTGDELAVEEDGIVG